MVISGGSRELRKPRFQAQLAEFCQRAGQNPVGMVGGQPRHHLAGRGKTGLAGVVSPVLEEARIAGQLGAGVRSILTCRLGPFDGPCGKTSESNLQGLRNMAHIFYGV